MKKRMAIIASNPGFGGCANINEAFHLHSTLYEPVEITAQPAPYNYGERARGNRLSITNFDDQETIKKILDDRETCLFIVDLSGLMVICHYLSVKQKKAFSHPYAIARGQANKDVDALIEELSRREVIFFWTGTQYLLNYDRVNEWVKRMGIKTTFAMPDLMRCDPKAKPLFQPHDYTPPLNGNKYVNFTITHSPGKKLDSKERLGNYWNEKGTEQIARVFDEITGNGIKTMILGGDFCVPHDVSILVKAKSHLFVDKITEHSAGVGKSGLESLALGVPVLCSMQHTRYEGRYAGIPVIDVRDEIELKENIMLLYGNKSLYKSRCEQTSEWAQIINYENTVKYLEQEMEW
ncbi:MAG: hypothetical protein PHS93_07615 [Candidatus Omnitrophica bacterium]|nr:hypothetical protein [Candidatus Omnitrophota bacterium]